MFGKGVSNYRQKQLDAIEISLITNENFIDAYKVLDENVDVVEQLPVIRKTILLSF